MYTHLALLFTLASCPHGTEFSTTSDVPVRRMSLYNNVYSKYEGDIYLAAMFSIHHYNGTTGCGRIIDQDGLQVITAAIFGLEWVRTVLKLPFRIGLLSIDTCQDPNYGIEQSKDFFLFKSCTISNTYKCSDNSQPTIREEYRSLQRIFGVFGAGNSDVSIMAANFLRLVDLPQISYFSTSPELSDETKYPFFFRTIPSDFYTVRAIAEILKRYNWNFILIVNDDSKYSISTKDNFKDYVKGSIKGNDTICIFGEITISTNESFSNLSMAINKIKDNTTKIRTPKVVVTFLNQAVVEELLKYVEMHPSVEMSDLLWIGTDSWGGRLWPLVTRNNSMLRKSLSIIPKATEMVDFEKYYKSRLPSVDDYNPWLARQFEDHCDCQYSNVSLFIYPELGKLRKQDINSSACEPKELTCSKIVYKESQQMPYIHYVIDGIFAYGHTVQNLIGDLCDGLDSSACAHLVWEKNILNYQNITSELKRLNFTDSTGVDFRFWNQRDGIPVYSLLYYNQSTSQWDNVGSVSVLENKMFGLKFRIEVQQYFDVNLRTNHSIPPCSLPCAIGSFRRQTNIPCCWICEPCASNAIVNTSQGSCHDCPQGDRPNANRTKCIEGPWKFMSLEELGAMIIFFGDLLGLIFCFFTLVIMITYWDTPIIKAFGKETSSIILFGTVIAFTFSVSLLVKPNKALCVLYWSAPALCSTICYASILTKTNRIVRIFGMNWSSKNKAVPKFVSPMSQMSIIALITLVETCILAVVVVSKKESLLQQIAGEIKCLKMEPGSVLAAFLIPILLLLASTVYAFKMRKTPDGFNETRNLNFMNFANCVVLVTSLFLYMLLTKYDAVYPLCLQMTLSAYGNIVGLFLPKIYLVICRPEKNTMECVTSRTRGRSQMSISTPNIQSSDINLVGTLGSTRCRKCHTLLQDATETSRINQSESSSSNAGVTPNSPSKVFFSDRNSWTNKYNSRERVIEELNGESNQAYNADL